MGRILYIIALISGLFASPEANENARGIVAFAESPALTQPSAAAPDKPATAAPAPPATLETTTTVESPASKPALDSATDDALTRFEAANAKMKSLTAKLVYDRYQGLLGDRQRRFGTITYAAPSADAGAEKPEARRRFRIEFDSLLVEKRKDKVEQSFVFDGTWLVERDGQQKTFIKRQVIAPGTPPEKADPLAMGEGPFPLPMSAKKADILKRFNASLTPLEKSDPANTLRLTLTPRAGQRMSYTSVDIWCDKETMAIVRMQTQDESENKSVIELNDRKLDSAVDAAAFDTAEPKQDGWRVEVKPWEQK